MLLELENFIYSLYPRQGYGITASSPKIDKQRWRAFCAPLPVDFQEVEKLGKVFALQTQEDQVVMSLFVGDAKDEFDRAGVYSHHIIIPAKDYLDLGAPLVPLIDHFIIDIKKAGDLPPLDIDSKDLLIAPEREVLSGIKPVVIEKLLSRLLENGTATVVCPQRNTEQMVHFVSAIFQLLPPSARFVSFVTAPLGRSYRKDREDTSFKLKLVQNRSIAPSGTDAYIEIDQDYPVMPATTPQSKAAHYLVNKFQNEGFEGVKTLFDIWEKRKTGNNDLLSKTRDFVRDIEVTQGVISVDVISEMRKKGQKQEAQSYARTVIDQRKWKSPRELAEILTMILEDSSHDIAERDISLLTSEVAGLNPSERFDTYESIAKNLPRIGDKLLSKLMGYYGDSFFINIGALSSYPTISSKLLDTRNYDSFKSISRQVLRGAVSDLNAFNGDLKHLLEKARKQFGEQTLDFVQCLLEDFPQRKDTIIGLVQKEDLFPASVMSRLSKEARQHLLSVAEKILQVLKGVLTP